ncbi:hypothetical protein [Brevibacterium yomogidense]|uniref:hypothetical protein n=1 Tax=Brevibacterium yomogidense TaxID=946573 RepID=UPI0018DFC6F7|nr:hypothetical protein [Brevibacterium yomogidense]
MAISESTSLPRRPDASASTGQNGLKYKTADGTVVYVSNADDLAFLQLSDKLNKKLKDVYGRRPRLPQR